MTWRNRVGTTSTGIAPFLGTSFIVGLATPHPVLLAGLDGPVQAGLGDLTAVADSPCSTTRQGKPGSVQEAGPAWSAEGFPPRCLMRTEHPLTGSVNTRWLKPVEKLWGYVERSWTLTGGCTLAN